MGLSHSPRIVTDGLVFCVDAANKRSYPGAGTTWTDLSSSKANGTLVNMTNNFSTDGAGGLIFDGTNERVDIDSTKSVMSQNAYTKIAWFYAYSFKYNIISGGSSAQHAFWLQGTDRLRAGHNASWSIVSSTTALSLNTWYHGAVTFNTSTGWVLYLNGLPEDTSGSTSTFSSSANTFYIGSYNGANLFHGIISNCLIYNRVLIPDEIKQNYLATKGRYA